MRRIRFLAEAAQEMEVGKTFYDRQQSGIGDYFWDSLLADIESLLIHAGVHIQIEGHYRMLSRRFPYAIYYQLSSEFITITAVLPMRRSPKWLEKQFSSRGKPGS